MKSRYDPSYPPPAPILEISLGAPGGSLCVGPLKGLMDTGADGSIVPLVHLEALGIQVDSQRILVGYGGGRRRVDIYLVDLAVGGTRLPGIEVVGDDREDEIIVGRNVLNKLRILLAGPCQIVGIRG